MPLYEYKCKSCGRIVEKLQKFSDPPFATCEFCKGELERLLSSSAIQFKGSGWYVTDYAKRSSASSGNSDSSPSAEKTDKKEKESTKSVEPAKTSPSKEK